jgi:hypothetical protein
MTAQLREEIVRLAPWHLEVEVSDGLTTAVSRQNGDDGSGISFLDARERVRWHEHLRTIYPDGLQGRTVIDAACNCGGYLFWAREIGAGESFGFDVREHWITQARFLQRARGEDGIRFERCDLYDVPSLDPGEFDIGIFKGIFYHLPDPIHGLKLIADRTREVLIVNTATRTDHPDGVLVCGQETAEVQHFMSGVHGLCWFPTGPKVLANILGWLGFPAMRVTFSLATPDGGGRIGVVAARDERFLERF